MQWLDLDVKTVRKINALVKECQRTPFTGAGKPEALKGNLRGHWSRRINQEHRLVYRIEADWCIASKPMCSSLCSVGITTKNNPIFPATPPAAGAAEEAGASA